MNGLIERYRDSLPFAPEDPVVTLGEGSTPHVLAERLSEREARASIRIGFGRYAEEEELVRALETVGTGGMYIDPALADILIRSTPARELGLTPRERDVLRLLADGHSNESIGRELFISPDTARTQLGAAMAKLGVSTRTQAVATALRHELIS